MAEGGLAREPSAFEVAFRRLAEGDRTAAPLVFAALWPKLLAFCERAVGAHGEDCAQRAMITLFERISSFDPARSPLGWAFAIAAWECRTQRRALGRSREVPGAAFDHPVAADPEADLVEHDLVQRALTLVASLPEIDRSTFEAELADAGEHGARHRQRRHRMFERLRAAWKRVHGS